MNPANQPLKSTSNGNQKQKTPKPLGPNNPFRECQLSFNGKRVIVATKDGEIRGRLACFDFASKGIAIDIDGRGPSIIFFYESVSLEAA